MFEKGCFSKWGNGEKDYSGLHLNKKNYPLSATSGFIYSPNKFKREKYLGTNLFDLE